LPAEEDAMQIKAVIFDLDNTLVDFMKMKREAVAAAARAMVDHGLPMKEEEAVARLFDIYDRQGIEYQEVLDHFLEEEMGRLDHRLLAAGVVAYRRAREANMVLYPHVKMTLMELIRRSYKLGVLSDAPSRQAWLRLASLGLLHYFQQVITYDDTGKRKPDPAPFQHMLEKLGLAHDQVLMVGDWPERDIQGARNLHIPTALALYGSDFDTENSGADFLLHSIDELLPILDTLNAGRHPGWTA
jgi:putative hydrolase of the HAD superfamily